MCLATLAIVNGNADGQCCRGKINCYACDSRDDMRCGEVLNDTINIPKILCDDLCVKLKYKHENQFYYIRNCANILNKTTVKKLDVCYTTRVKNGGHLCFCETELCNHTTHLHSSSTKIIFYLCLTLFSKILAEFFFQIDG
jgi:hypothetical protein